MPVVRTRAKNKAGPATKTRTIRKEEGVLKKTLLAIKKPSLKKRIRLKKHVLRIVRLAVPPPAVVPNFFSRHKHVLLAISGLALILAVTFALPEPGALGATYTFTQGNWNSATANTATHPGDQSGWSQFSTSSGIAAGSNISLATSSLSVSARSDVTQAPYPSSISRYEMAKDDTGVMHVAYISKEYSSSSWNIAYRNSNDWNTRVDVTADNATAIPNTITPKIAVASGTVYISYVSNEFSASCRNLALRTSVNWSSRTDITSNSGDCSLGPNIGQIDAYFRNGTLHMAYVTDSSGAVSDAIIYANSTNWSNKTTVLGGNNLRSLTGFKLIVNSSDVATVYYMSTELNSVTNIAARSSPSFSSRTDITTATSGAPIYVASNMAGAIDSNGTTHLAYVSTEFNGYYNIASRKSDAWSVRTDITTSTRGNQAPYLVADGNDLHITYKQNTPLKLMYGAGPSFAESEVLGTYVDGGTTPNPLIIESGVAKILHATYEYGSMGPTTVYNLALRTSADTWSSRTDITKIYDIGSRIISSVTDASGTIHVAYVSLEYNARSWNLAYRNSNNWNNRVDLTTDSSSTIIPTNEYWVSIAASPNGTVGIIYTSRETNPSLRGLNYRNSANWSNRTDIATGSAYQSPTLMYASDGTAHLVYHSYEYNPTYSNIAYRNSSNWSTRVDITTKTNGFGGLNPDAVIDDNDVVHVVYKSSEYATYYNLAYRNSLNWTSRTDLTTTTLSAINPDNWDIAVAADGTVGVTYQSNEYNTSYSNVVYRSSEGWSNRVDVTAYSTSYAIIGPKIRFDTGSNAQILYASNEPGSVSISYRTETNWSNRITVASNATLSYGNLDSYGGQINLIYYSQELNQPSNSYNIAYRSIYPAGYNQSGYLVSSPYDTISAANIMGEIAWNEGATLPGGTSVTVSLRTASSSPGLSSAIWSDLTSASPNCAKNSGIVTCVAAALPAGMRDGSGDQFYQYKVTLTGGGNTPTVDDIVVKYVVNAPPEFEAAFGTNGVASLQDATSTGPTWGKVLVDYSVRDIDTTSGATPNSVAPSFEYNIGGAWISIPADKLGASDLSAKSVGESSYTRHTATWDAKAQIPATYTPNARIRVTVNDGEAANNTAIATGGTFVLDTKNPVLTATYDASADQVRLNASDDRNMEYRLSNNADQSSDGANGTSGAWQSATTTVSSTLGWNGGLAGTIYIEARDEFGNSVSSTIVTPTAPYNFDLRDISNSQTGEYREFISWSVHNNTSSAIFSRYEIFRSMDGGDYSLRTTINNSSTNYFSEVGLSSSTMYSYKVRTVDTDGDVSDFSAIISDRPDGQGGTDFTPPTISNVQAAEVQATWARITWTTDELSNSRVDFGTSTSYGGSASSSAMVTAHEVFVSGLEPNTTYYFRVKSVDVLNNEGGADNGGAGFTFTTLGGARITDVTTSIVDSVRATVVWNTDRAADSYVVYAANTESLRTGTGITQVGSATLVSGPPYQHSVDLTGLIPRTTYYYYVKSTDASANLTAETKGGAYYSFTTTYDTKPPVIDNVMTPVIAFSSVVVTWTTDELADGRVEYGSVSGQYTHFSEPETTYSMNHAGSMTGLAQEKEYFYRVRSVDPAGNVAYSPENTVTTVSQQVNQVNFTTIVSSTDSVAPTVSNVKVSDISAFSAKIEFETNEPTTGYVLYGRDTKYGNTAANSETGTKHSIQLSGLRLGTKHHYQIRAKDKAGNMASLADATFETKFASEALDGLTTLENASQFQDQLEGLVESVLPSLVPPFIGKIEVRDITETSAKIRWTTNVPAFSGVAFIQDREYDPEKGEPYGAEIGQASTKSTTHEVELVNLVPSTKYHFQARAFALPGVVGKSPDQTFTTKSLKIRPEVSRVGNTDMEVRWVTPEDSSSFVEYRNLTTGRVSREGDSALTKSHVIRIQNLTPNTSYELRISGQDSRNNPIQSDPITVKTKQDKISPQISGVRIDNALLPGRSDRLQSVISWKTDEPANSVVYFDEGAGVNTDLKSKAGKEDEYTTTHMVIITSFKPSTVYRIKVGSADESGNATTTPMRTILTPRSAETVLDIIIKNLQESFGFLQQLR